MTVTVREAQQPLVVDMARTRVPWWTVLPIAVVLAFGDGFWMITLRGAVGAVERTDAPFTRWLQESTLSLPLFVIAVLGALTLAMRWFGPSPRGRALSATALIIVAAGTLAGIAEIAASSAYDYHLQTNLLQMMTAMRGTCSAGSCLTELQDASLQMQFRAIGYGAVILLVTNLVLVGWVMAFRGGRLDVVRRRRPHTQPAAQTLPVKEARTSRVDDVRLLLVAALVGSAVVHAAVVPEHLDEWTAAGMFFVALTAGELAVAGMVHVRQRGAALLAVAMSIGTLVLWLYSRTAGLPFGPEAGVPEAVGLADCAACALELATLVVAVVLMRRLSRLRQRPPVSQHVGWIVVSTVVAVTVLGVAGSSLTWFSIIGSPMTMESSE